MLVPTASSNSQTLQIILSGEVGAPHLMQCESFTGLCICSRTNGFNNISSVSSSLNNDPGDFLSTLYRFRRTLNLNVGAS